MLLQVNKPITINRIQGATVPDGIAKIGNLKLEDDGTLTYSILYYTDADSIDDAPISYEVHNMNIPNLENQIMANAKTKPSLSGAVEL